MGSSAWWSSLHSWGRCFYDAVPTTTCTRSRGITARPHPRDHQRAPLGSRKTDAPVEVPKHAYPESTVRLTDSATVRLTSPPPDRRAAGGPTRDGRARRGHHLRRRVGPGAGGAGTRTPDPAIGSMNHRPRRLLAPGLAVPRGAGAGRNPAGVRVAPGGARDSYARQTTSRTTTPHPTTTDHATTAPSPAVSAPQVTSASDATYAVAASNFTLILSATSSDAGSASPVATGASCSPASWPRSAADLPATGLVSVEIGAPPSSPPRSTGRRHPASGLSDAVHHALRHRPRRAEAGLGSHPGAAATCGRMPRASSRKA